MANLDPTGEGQLRYRATGGFFDIANFFVVRKGASRLVPCHWSMPRLHSRCPSDRSALRLVTDLIVRVAPNRVWGETKTAAVQPFARLGF